MAICACLLIGAVLILGCSIFTTIYYKMHQENDKLYFKAENIPLLVISVGLSLLVFYIFKKKEIFTKNKISVNYRTTVIYTDFKILRYFRAKLTFVIFIASKRQLNYFSPLRNIFTILFASAMVISPSPFTSAALRSKSSGLSVDRK